MTFNRLKAVEYAQTWALSRNPKYKAFDKLGGDCTNYISQCMFAGGIEMTVKQNGWFYHSLASRAPAWTGVNEFFAFAISNKSQGLKCKIGNLNNCNVGDVVQFEKNGKYFHSAIITKVINSSLPEGVLVCAHDNNALNRRLSTYAYHSLRILNIFV